MMVSLGFVMVSWWFRDGAGFVVVSLSFVVVSLGFVVVP